MKPRPVAISTDFIRLDQFMKFADLAGGGGEAKMLIQSGEVRVNGEVETRRGKKLYEGDVVALGGQSAQVSR
ncbi:RNA-binding S4 domain-containing protein [bacterium]|nr:MAG: RNA-binding S4 domain-containing protein [bacterium]